MSAARPQKAFISRTTAGLKDTAEKVADILRSRGIDVIIQTEFLPHWRDVKGMLQDKLIECDAALCLIGPAHGMEMRESVTGLKDPRTEGRVFSYTQLEILVARDLPRPVFTFFLSGEELIATYPDESADLVQRQQDFIKEFAKDGGNTYGTFDTWAALADTIERLSVPRTATADKPCNLPYATLGSLFKGRDSFLADLRARLTSESAAVIKGHAIHGMGGVGKTRAALEYAWRYAEEYRALLFVSADSPDALQRNLAALCGPLVLNLPEHGEKDQNVQVAAALRWFERNPGWFLILDNADTEDALAATEELVTKLSQGKCVITSRLSDYSGSVTALELDVLADKDAAAFLMERTAGHRTIASDDDARALDIAAMLDGLALALEQAAACIRKTRSTFAEYIAHWRSNTAAALAWHDAKKMHYPRSLAITFETSVAQLSDPAKEFFRVLSWFAPDPIPFSALTSEHAPANASALLPELENLHLARRREDGSALSIHRLVQEITRQQQPSPPPPPALITALEWINGAFPFESDDVRFWPIAEPLAPHAHAVAWQAAERAVPVPTAYLLSRVASLYDAKAQYQAAEPLMRRALDILENKGGIQDPQYPAALNNLALLLQATNRLAEAEPLMHRVISMHAVSFGENHPDVATSLNNLARLLKETNRHAEAEPLVRRALAISKVCLGNDHPNVARDLDNLASLLEDTNRLAEAEPLKRRALAILEAFYGEGHPQVAAGLINLATLFQATNRVAEAESLMRRALGILEASYGEDHPQVAAGLNNLATLLQATNRMAEAEPLMRRALAIDEAFFGKDHPDVAIRLSNLAWLLKATNRLAEAEPLMRRALDIHEASYGEDNPAVAIDLTNLALLLQDTNRVAEAEPLMRRALAMGEASFGKDHPKVGNRLNNLGLLLKDTNRPAEAEPPMRRALAILEDSLGRDHPQVGLGLNNVAMLLHATNRLAEAEPLYRRALAIQEASLGANHPEVASFLNNLAGLLKATNRRAEAEPLMQRMVRILVAFTVSTGHRHPHLETFVNNYRILLEMGDTEEQAREKIAKILEPILGRKRAGPWRGKLAPSTWTISR